MSRVNARSPVSILAPRPDHPLVFASYTSPRETRIVSPHRTIP